VEIDRREAYYERVAKVIAADPLDFYCRAEKGRRFQATITNPVVRLRRAKLMLVAFNPQARARGCV
jgi:hypothetical protein